MCTLETIPIVEKSFSYVVINRSILSHLRTNVLVISPLIAILVAVEPIFTKLVAFAI